MLIAVDSWGDNGYKIGDDICVFDTSDCTAEIVKESVIAEYAKKLDIRNLGFHTVIGKYYVYEYDITDLLPEAGDFVTFSDNILKIGDRKSIKIESTLEGLQINGQFCTRSSSHLINYMFLYRDYVVLRCSQDYINSDYFTVIVDSNGHVDYYSCDLSVYTNKELMMKIEMLSDGV